MPPAAGDLPLEGPHWNFAVRFYEQPGVAEACLMLQDRRGLDIVVMLFALFHFVTRRSALSVEMIGRLDATVMSWRRDIVYPLRSVRRRLKAELGARAGDAADRLRKQVADAGVFAEQIELALLAVHEETAARCTADASAQVADVLRNVIGFYTKMDDLGPEESQALRVIVEAARQFDR